MVPLNPPLRVLDVGCGTGQSRQLYIDRSKVYAAIDLAEAALKVARNHFSDAFWIKADACQLPFEDNSWDVVAFSSVLHHIPDFSIALREAYRVLRPGGYVFAFDPNLLHPAMALLRWPKSPFYSPHGVSPNESPLLPVELRRGFAKAGFEQIQQHCQADLPYRRVAPRFINMMLGIYNLSDRLFSLSGLARWFGTFVLTAAPKPMRPAGEITR
jgi:ubiquinone/menaquinone biosynthesis C-methylase UbiE